VTRGDVPNDEMPNIKRPGRRDVFPPSDAALAALLAGTEAPVEPAPGLRPVVDILAALRAEPTGAELAGEARALAEFRRGTGALAPPGRSRHRKARGLPARFGAKAAAAAGIAALSVGGLATAALVGVLPGPAQRIAHQDFGAPAAPAADAGSGSSHVKSQVNHAERHVSASPQATNPVAGFAVPRLCTVYARARAHGSAMQQQVIDFRYLIRAAGGAGRVNAYCGHTVLLPAGTGARPPDRRGVPPRRYHRRFPYNRGGRGSLPGEWVGHHSPHPNGKASAHRHGRRGQHHRPYVPGTGAQMIPTRHRAVPARS
jgi:hypothetical protein